MRPFLVLVIVPVAAAVGQTVTPQAPVAPAGDRIELKSSKRVGWCMLPGATGVLAVAGSRAPTCPARSAPAATATYTAPATGIEALTNVGGCTVLPNDSIYNTRIDNLPIDPHSDLWMSSGAYTGSGTTGQMYLGPFNKNVLFWTTSWDVNIIDNSVPARTQNFHYSRLYNNIPFQVPPAPKRKRESGSLGTFGSNDHHIVSVNHETCQWYETYQDNPHLCDNCITASSGWTYSSASYAQPPATDGGFTTDAAGLPLEPLTLRAGDIRSGEIHHAMRLTISGGYIQQGTGQGCPSCVGHLWPALGTTGYGHEINPPMGSRLRLKASFDISPFAQPAQIVLTALKHYGMVIADISGGGELATAGNDSFYDPAVRSALQQIQGLPMTNFEIVDDSLLQLNPALNTATPANRYVTPVNSAVVMAGDTPVPIALQPVTVGVQGSYVAIQAGMTHTFTAFVNGTSNRAVTWAVNGCSAGEGKCGVVNATTGVYTAPNAIPDGTVLTATVTATSVQHTQAKADIYLDLIPSGVIRIDTGNSSQSYRDSHGNLWLPDIVVQLPSYGAIHDDYPGGDWVYDAHNRPNPDYQLYKTSIYMPNDDIHYGPFIVPNGNYVVTLFTGVGNDQGGNPICNGVFGQWSTYAPFNTFGRGPFHVEAQGQITNHYWDPGVISQYLCFEPVTLRFPARVTDNELYVAFRAWGDDKIGRQYGPYIAGLTVEPDSSKPHWTIDAQQRTVLRPGWAIQFYVTDWYTGLRDPTWSMEGPGSLAPNGVYKAPASMAVTTP
ncbi:MAG: hypothetical protein JOZ62_03045, partial [Acidobacteriaceae bacterium]|nr:hypothetical protein [Acidobacteriaceae bacterium]